MRVCLAVLVTAILLPLANSTCNVLHLPPNETGYLVIGARGGFSGGFFYHKEKDRATSSLAHAARVDLSSCRKVATASNSSTLYWLDKDSIKTVELANCSKRILVNQSISRNISDLSLAGNLLYIAEVNFRISALDVTTGSRAQVVAFPGSRTTHVALDVHLPTRRIYWSHGKEIYFASTDGSGQGSLFNNTYDVTTLRTTADGSSLYVSATDNGTSYISRLDGISQGSTTQQTNVNSLTGAVLSDLAVSDSQLYVAVSNNGSVYSLNTSVPSASAFVYGFSMRTSVCLHHVDLRANASDWSCPSNSCPSDHLCLPGASPGSFACKCIDGMVCGAGPTGTSPTVNSGQSSSQTDRKMALSVSLAFVGLAALALIVLGVVYLFRRHRSTRREDRYSGTQTTDIDLTSQPNGQNGVSNANYFTGVGADDVISGEKSAPVVNNLYEESNEYSTPDSARLSMPEAEYVAMNAVPGHEDGDTEAEYEVPRELSNAGMLSTLDSEGLYVAGSCTQATADLMKDLFSPSEEIVATSSLMDAAQNVTETTGQLVQHMDSGGQAN